MAERHVVIDGGPLSVPDVVAVARHHAPVSLAPSVNERMTPARGVVEAVLAEGRTVYGVTTGFGAFASTRIEPAQAEAMQVSLLRSHASGVGPLLEPELVRAMMLLRARTLAQGYSGVRPLIVERLVEMLNRDILPVVPSQGSVGASGDLAPFAHLALPLIGEGEVTVGGERGPAAVALIALGMEPVTLAAKEGLSLLNGTEGMLSFGMLGSHRAGRLAVAADIACAMSVEALLGSARPFDPRIHALRPHPGQQVSAANIAALVAGSSIGESHREDFVHAVQDAYSLRCAPQVHGGVRDALSYAQAVFEREAGSVVDNPIVFADSGDVVSGGNFHGQPLAIALDTMTIGITELASISERRIDRILDPERSAGLPPFLAARPGLESGYMLVQYTAAALVAESRVLSHPASVESIPTSGSQEDHVSMGWGAGRNLWEVLANASRVLAIEMLCAAEGIEYRAPLRPAPAAVAVLSAIRDRVPRLTEDRPLGSDIDAIAELIEDGSLAEAASSATGRLN